MTVRLSTAEVLSDVETEIEREMKISRLHQYRERRIELPKTTLGRIHFHDFYENKVEGSLVNVSRYGARVELSQQQGVLPVGLTTRATVTLEGTTVYSGLVTFTNETQINSEIIAYGLLLQEPGIDLDQVLAVLGTSATSDSLIAPKSLLKLSQAIRPEFKILVADLNTVFQELKSKLNEEQERIRSVAKGKNHQRRMEEHSISVAISLYTDDIHAVFRLFKEVIDKLGPDESAIHKRYFRANFHPSVLSTPFINRAFTKPQGYAGDYGLMKMLYEYEDQGDSLFDKFLHRFSCNEPAAVANKNRVELLSGMLLDELDAVKACAHFKVSSIACGPGRELESFVELVPADVESKIELVALDQDSVALDYAQERIKPVCARRPGTKATFLHEDAVLGLIRERPFGRFIDGSNVIISAGLFDYLSDRVAQKLISILFRHLAPGGVLLIGNVSDQNPDRFSMDYFMEWNLVLRSPEGLQSLVKEDVRSVRGVTVDVVAESLGLNLFLRVRKPD